MAAVLVYARESGVDYGGDGTFYDDFEDQLELLPECENDEDWELMRNMIGVTQEQLEGYGDTEEFFF